MSKTNSNSITSILIYELNNNALFKNAMLNIFNEKSKEFIPDDVFFYDGTHSPLKLKTMGTKEVDIYARIPGKYKIYLMIEVKAGIYEDLQTSQMKNGEYQKTSKEEDIPLFFIIPKAYAHRNDENFIHENNIEWEEILKIAKDTGNDKIINQIHNFVEITEENDFSKDTTESIKKIKYLENYVAERQKSINVLSDCLKNVFEKRFVESQYEFGYYWNNDTDTFFLGFSYLHDDYTLSLDITESTLNTELGKDDFYFLEGWYYIPIKKNYKNIKTIDDLKKAGFQRKYYSKLNFDSLDILNSANQKNTFHLINLLKETYEEIFASNNDYELGNYQNDENGIGYYFKEKKNKKRDFFIGINPILNDKSYWFSIALSLDNIEPKKEWYVDKDNNEEYAYFQIIKQNLLNCKSKEEFKNELENELKRIINSI